MVRGGVNVSETVGWLPTCKCYGEVSVDEAVDLPTVPCLVLDPFAGSGTTLRVAVKHRRRAIGLDLNTDYHALQKDRATVQMEML